ncbi:MAG: methyltransferase domain-containing protein, partial [Desulfobacterales bacterium]|nr:methyltransferase domain-containing protein [Desulfobacterales bacterium]
MRDERLKKAQQVIIPETIEIYQGDCLELSKQLKDNSVDCIITDPPYPYDFIECWSKLGQIAKRVLKPGGFCLAYTGVMYLDEVMSRMGEHLDYFWTISLILSGPGSKTYVRSVVNRH